MKKLTTLTVLAILGAVILEDVRKSLSKKGSQTTKNR